MSALPQYVGQAQEEGCYIFRGPTGERMLLDAQDIQIMGLTETLREGLAGEPAQVEARAVAASTMLTGEAEGWRWFEIDGHWAIDNKPACREWADLREEGVDVTPVEYQHVAIPPAVAQAIREAMAL